jgi:cytidylate kinase
MTITIDGPVASGKTSVARAVAQQLGYVYLASGMLYRAVAYSLLHYYGYDEIALSDPQNSDIDAVVKDLVYTIEDGPQVYYGETNVTPYLKTLCIDKLSSLLATTPYVHEALAAFQRNFAKQKNIVVESRDAGTVVFPHASCKFFLTADSAERARRWQRDQEKQGVYLEEETCQKLIAERDLRDMTRAVSPLVQAPDAQLIDSTYMSFEEVVEHIVACAQDKKVHVA